MSPEDDDDDDRDDDGDDDRGAMRTDSDSSAWATSPQTSPELPPRISVDSEVSIAGQNKRKRQCSFSGKDRRNAPLSMSSPSEARPALPRYVTYHVYDLPTAKLTID